MHTSVNPRIGTGKHGNCLIGPCLPFGLVRLGPDVAYPQPNSGYRPGKAIIGFSHTRLAGTGGAGRYGNIRIMPFPGDPKRLKGPPYLTFPATNRNWSKPIEETAEVGYYHCRLPYGVEAELTCTRHVGVHRYTFEESPTLLVDFGALLQAGVAPAGQAPYCEDWEMEGRCTDGEVAILNDHEIAGRSDFLGGWGHFEPYAVYFFIRSREAFTKTLLANEDSAIHGREGRGPGLRAVLRYPATRRQIHLEVGISLQSIALARTAVETESHGADFAYIRECAEKAWAPWLNRIEVEGGTSDQTTLLKTSLLRQFTLPTNLAVNGAPHFTDITCLWDSIRNANSLQHLIAPEHSADLMNSLLETARDTGWLPDADIAGHFAYQQSGCSAEILFSEAARKEIPGVDYSAALAACVRNAETASPEPDYFGRYLDDYETLGYLSTRVPKGSVSRHLEYTYQDWCIARLAEHLGDGATAARFDARSARLWNLWNKSAGWFLPRNPDGTWVKGIDPETHSWDGWNDPYSYEGSLAYWSFCGLQDIPGLIKRRGGAAAFVSFLDDFLSRNDRIEKETRMIIPHLYAFAGRPDRTAAVIRRSLAERYLNSPDGMPDDEDMGCQSAYYITNSIGLYPIYGQTLYSLVPPVFERSVLRYGDTGNALTIIRRGDGPAIRSVRVNGRALAGTLLPHIEIADGGTLEISC